jgi:hypothetical protein
VPELRRRLGPDPDDPLLKLLSTLQELTATPKMSADKHYSVSFDVVAPANLFEDGR